MFAMFCRLLLNFARLITNFAWISPELRGVSKLFKIKCGLIVDCKIYNNMYLIFMVNYLFVQCWRLKKNIFNCIPSTPRAAADLPQVEGLDACEGAERHPHWTEFPPRGPGELRPTLGPLISRRPSSLGRCQLRWGAYYRLFSRANWRNFQTNGEFSSGV